MLPCDGHGGNVVLFVYHQRRPLPAWTLDMPESALKSYRMQPERVVALGGPPSQSENVRLAPCETQVHDVAADAMQQPLGSQSFDVFMQRLNVFARTLDSRMDSSIALHDISWRGGGKTAVALGCAM